MISSPTPSPTPLPLPVESPTLSPENAIIYLQDESAVMAGICFESAHDAAGRAFVLRNATELDLFFDLADNSQLCRHPVVRHTFNFANRRVLAGLWSQGWGCTATHEVLFFHRDDVAQEITIQLRLNITGDCNYELVRPFWIGLDAASEYTVSITTID